MKCSEFEFFNCFHIKKIGIWMTLMLEFFFYKNLRIFKNFYHKNLLNSCYQTDFWHSWGYFCEMRHSLLLWLDCWSSFKVFLTLFACNLAGTVGPLLNPTDPTGFWAWANSNIKVGLWWWILNLINSHFGILFKLTQPLLKWF